MRTVFQYAGHDPEQLHTSFADFVRKEFYDGRLIAEPATEFDVTVEKALAHPISLVAITSNVGLSYRRSVQDIRANKVGLRVIWFVRRGALKISRSSNTCTVARDECVILDSNRPFFAQATTGEDGTFEAIEAIVPAHLFVSHLAGAIEGEGAFRLNAESGRAINRLLELIFEEGDNLSRNAASPLAVALLEALADTLEAWSGGTAIRRERVVDRRLIEIETYITKNLTNPDLSYEEVAAKCGISPRYLSYVLKASNTCFSTLLWGQRLPKARDWLAAPALGSHPIQEIAFMAGFKSAAHFSRMFKEAYGCSPKQYRIESQATAKALTAAQPAPASGDFAAKLSAAA